MGVETSSRRWQRDPFRTTGGGLGVNCGGLIDDWNQVGSGARKPLKPVLLNDESLRDGLQSASVRDPSIAWKIAILYRMEELGIQFLDLGLPGAGPRAVADVQGLAREIVSCGLKIRANCAARTHENDIRPIADIVQRTGLNIEAATFLGPVRYGAISRGGPTISCCGPRKTRFSTRARLGWR